jgi:hypothetical protein
MSFVMGLINILAYIWVPHGTSIATNLINFVIHGMPNIYQLINLLNNDLARYWLNLQPKPYTISLHKYA